MKKTDWLNELLLQQAGELSPRRERRLQRHLEGHPELAEEARQVRDLQGLSRSGEEDFPLPDRTLQAILGEARVLEAEKSIRHAAPTPARWWVQPRWAVAGALLLLVAGWMMLTSPRPAPPMVAHQESPREAVPAWDDSIDESFEELESLLAMVSEDTSETDIDELVRELMELEGTEI